MSENEIKIVVDESIDLEDIDIDTYIMLQMDNGEQMFGLFRGVDGDMIILKDKNKGLHALGWPLDRVAFWGFVHEVE